MKLERRAAVVLAINHRNSSALGPMPPPLQTRDRRDPAEGKVEAQAARIKALESGFDVLKDRYEKASGLVEKYEAPLKKVRKEHRR